MAMYTAKLGRRKHEPTPRDRRFPAIRTRMQELRCENLTRPRSADDFATIRGPNRRAAPGAHHCLCGSSLQRAERRTAAVAADLLKGAKGGYRNHFLGEIKSGSPRRAVNPLKDRGRPENDRPEPEDLAEAGLWRVRRRAMLAA